MLWLQVLSFYLTWFSPDTTEQSSANSVSQVGQNIIFCECCGGLRVYAREVPYSFSCSLLSPEESLT